MKNKMINHSTKLLVLFMFGAFIYAMIEIVWRGYTHWTMAVLGGFIFLLIGGINNWLPWEMPLWLQAVVGGLLITAAELIAGLILNIWLGLGIWDYSGMPFNIAGQICPQFTIAWVGLSLFAIVLDDYLRHWIFGEKKPNYVYDLNMIMKERRNG